MMRINKPEAVEIIVLAAILAVVVFSCYAIKALTKTHPLEIKITKLEQEISDLKTLTGYRLLAIATDVNNNSATNNRITKDFYTAFDRRGLSLGNQCVKCHKKGKLL